ncbi:hypothetical protein IEQ34_000426 [Dendrobium chrysotoxum]|uniref:Uncharacterized protein n=1 Tax=Dendrobium chrysotoxum TaxID=161865 RepID=A0AAV7HT15_DENCH|nr:hypothetical protein IEQ34_000426 [Dendrobium chrysotoxum]
MVNGEAKSLPSASMIRSHSAFSDLHGIQPDPVAGLVEIREEYVEETQSKEPKIGLSNTIFLSSSKEHSSLVPDEEDVSDLDDDEDDETTSSSEVEDDENASYLKGDEG